MAGGWYHVSCRGNRREALFHDEADRRGSSDLGLVAELPVNAFVAEAVRGLAGLKYQAAAQALRRFQADMAKDTNWSHEWNSRPVAQSRDCRRRGELLPK